MKMRKSYGWVLIAAAACLAFAMRIGHESIWYDEACSSVMAGYSPGKVFPLTAYDNHPPLFYMLLSVVRHGLGNSEAALRSLSALAAVALVLLGAGPVRRLFDNRAGFIYAGVMLFTPAVLMYAQEARMYTLAILAVTASALYGYLAVQAGRRSSWAWFGIASLAAAYLHYYGLLAAGFMHLFVLAWIVLRKRSLLKIHLLTGAAVAAGYLPWLIVLVNQAVGVSKGFWLAPPTVIDVYLALVKPFVYKDFYPGIAIHMNLALLFAVILILYGLVLAFRRRAAQERTFSLFLLFAYFAVMLTAIVVSLAIAPIFYSRYMMVCMGLLLLLVVLGMRALPGKILPLAALVLYAALNLPTIINVYTQDFNHPMKALAQDLGSEIQPGDLLITSDSYSLGAAFYYFPQAEHYYTNNSREGRWGHVLKPFTPPLHNDKGLAELLVGRQSLWYITVNTGLSKNIRTILKGQPGWEPTLAPRSYSDPYSPVSFTAQKYTYTGQEPAARGAMSVRIRGLKPKGGAFVVLYDRQSGYWDGPLSKVPPPYRFENMLVERDTLLYTFDGLDYGEYVLVIAQDENDNHWLDLDEQGLPLEGTYISNMDRMDLSRGLQDFEFEWLKFTFNQPEQKIEAPLRRPPFK